MKQKNVRHQNICVAGLASILQQIIIKAVKQLIFYLGTVFGCQIIIKAKCSKFETLELRYVNQY